MSRRIIDFLSDALTVAGMIVLIMALLMIAVILGNIIALWWGWE